MQHLALRRCRDEGEVRYLHPKGIKKDRLPIPDQVGNKLHRNDIEFLLVLLACHYLLEKYNW